MLLSAVIVDSPEDVIRHLQSNVELQKAYPWQRLLTTAVEHGKSPRVTRLCLGATLLNANLAKLHPSIGC